MAQANKIIQPLAARLLISETPVLRISWGNRQNSFYQLCKGLYQKLLWKIRPPWCILLGVLKISTNANPFARKGRKATGLYIKTAGLPKDNIFGLRGFFMY
jgi:hypothetical protein